MKKNSTLVQRMFFLVASTICMLRSGATFSWIAVRNESPDTQCVAIGFYDKDILYTQGVNRLAPGQQQVLLTDYDEEVIYLYWELDEHGPNIDGDVRLCISGALGFTRVRAYGSCHDSSLWRNFKEMRLVPDTTLVVPIDETRQCRGKCKSGFGVLFGGAGERYVGSFDAKGLPHGEGWFFKHDSTIYASDWKHGKLNGEVEIWEEPKTMAERTYARRYFRNELVYVRGAAHDGLYHEVGTYANGVRVAVSIDKRKEGVSIRHSYDAQGRLHGRQYQNLRGVITKPMYKHGRVVTTKRPRLGKKNPDLARLTRGFGLH